MRTGALLAVAFVLLILGLSLGLAPGSATGANGKDFSCGSPWNMDTKEISHQQYLDDLANSMVGKDVWKTDYRQGCEDKLGTRGVFAWITISLGAVALIGVALVRKPEGTNTIQPESVEPGA